MMKQHRMNEGAVQVHVSVAGTEPDHLAKLINEKAEELDTACIVMASHGKTSFQVYNIVMPSEGVTQCLFVPAAAVNTVPCMIIHLGLTTHNG